MTKPTLLVALVAMLAFPLGASAQFSPRSGVGAGAEIGAFFAARGRTPDVPSARPECRPAAPGLGMAGALGLPAGCVVPAQPTAPSPSIERSMPPGDIVFGGAFEPTEPESTTPVTVSPRPATPVAVTPSVNTSAVLPPAPATAVQTPSAEATAVLPSAPPTVVFVPSADATAGLPTPSAPGLDWGPPPPPTVSVAVSPRTPPPVRNVPVAAPTVHVHSDAPPQTAVVVTPKVPTATEVEICPWTGTTTVTRRSSPAETGSSSRATAGFSFSASASFSFGS